MNFENRHIGINSNDLDEILKVLKVQSIDELINETVPDKIRLNGPLNIEDGISEKDWLQWCENTGNENLLFKSYIGQGYYDALTPPVILRNIFENPGWYTAYTPYQAEIAQGRLEALLNFQTMVCDLTGMEIANASLLDEATAAAEAMIMLWGNRSRKEIAANKNTFLVDANVFESTLKVLKTRAKYLGINVKVCNQPEQEVEENVFGAFVQYTNKFGEINNFIALSESLHQQSSHLVVGTDLLSLCLIKEPAVFGADVVIGSSQRFGVPVGFGGPHAAFFATHEKFKRVIPGRIIGVSKDAKGRTGFRMALQTREQHIKREKATSNICTAQALLAIMASMYAVYHGPKGLKNIALKVHNNTVRLQSELKSIGINVDNEHFFDTLSIDGLDIKKIKEISEKKSINFKYHQKMVSLSINETVDEKELSDIISVFEEYTDQKSKSNQENQTIQLGDFKRESTYLNHPVFNTYHSETEMMRYIKRLENKDISLVNSMISLGSCTMKLNAAAQMMPLSNPRFNSIHPFAPKNQTKGYQKVIFELGEYLKEITGFDGISFQPNSGAQGELAGLLTIRRYFESRGENHRNIVIIPQSAHGTNPASATMAGLKVVVTKCDEDGNIDIDSLKENVEKHKENLAALMVTYPSTHGVFENHIIEVNEIIHNYGGQVYMDGANMNAQVGITSPAIIGADVCHLNLHKTFAIPHGGGGPGMGPIGVAKHLIDFLPNSDFESDSNKSLGVISGAPYSSALILLISLGYIKLLGGKGCTESTKYAILNANYLKEKLKDFYPILYTGNNSRVGHEMIIDCRVIKKETGIDIMDIAKRLIDFGLHAPTVSFPVAGTLMIEPTESESLRELNHFCDAMIQIAKEIDEIKEGKYPKDNNVLINAPHPAEDLICDEWEYPYSRKKAAYPISTIITNKYWTSVGRIDNAFGDRNLICSCPNIEEYA